MNKYRLISWLSIEMLEWSWCIHLKLYLLSNSIEITIKCVSFSIFIKKLLVLFSVMKEFIESIEMLVMISNPLETIGVLDVWFSTGIEEFFFVTFELFHVAFFSIVSWFSLIIWIEKLTNRLVESCIFLFFLGLNKYFLIRLICIVVISWYGCNTSFKFSSFS